MKSISVSVCIRQWRETLHSFFKNWRWVWMCLLGVSAFFQNGTGTQLILRSRSRERGTYLKFHVLRNTTGPRHLYRVPSCKKSKFESRSRSWERDIPNGYHSNEKIYPYSHLHPHPSNHTTLTTFTEFFSFYDFIVTSAKGEGEGMTLGKRWGKWPHRHSQPEYFLLNNRQML